MDWDKLRPPPNPFLIRAMSWAAFCLLGIYAGFSTYALLMNMPLLFSRLGTVGIGAILIHYVFVRFTWRRRAESIGAMENSAFTGFLLDKTKGVNLKGAEELIYEVAAAKRNFGKEEAISTTVEALLLSVATLQSGFGDAFVHVVHCGTLSCPT